MARVKGSNTRPELLVRSILHSHGFRFRLHRKDLPGNPDIVLSRHRKVIFIHGCFWHGHQGCPRSTRPSTNREFWDRKLSGNMERDKRVLMELKELGWNALVIWTCEMKKVENIEVILSRFLSKYQENEKDTRSLGEAS